MKMRPGSGRRTSATWVEKTLTIALEAANRCPVVFTGTPAELRADATVRKEWLED
jgi:branched-chain amino acid transport system ATP-binding protein